MRRTRAWRPHCVRVAAHPTVGANVRALPRCGARRVDYSIRAGISAARSAASSSAPAAAAPALLRRREGRAPRRRWPRTASRRCGLASSVRGPHHRRPVAAPGRRPHRRVGYPSGRHRRGGPKASSSRRRARLHRLEARRASPSRGSPSAPAPRGPTVRGGSATSATAHLRSAGRFVADRRPCSGPAGSSLRSQASAPPSGSPTATGGERRPRRRVRCVRPRPAAR